MSFSPKLVKLPVKPTLSQDISFITGCLLSVLTLLTNCKKIVKQLGAPAYNGDIRCLTLHRSDNPETNSVHAVSCYDRCTKTHMTHKDFTLDKDLDKTCSLNNGPVELIPELLVNQWWQDLKKRGRTRADEWKEGVAFLVFYLYQQ